VRRALATTRRARSDDPVALFRRALGHHVAAAPPDRAREAVPPLNPISDDPY
jgi:hypothetical protein